MKKPFHFIFFLLSFSLVFNAAQAEQNNPWRDLFKDIPTISKNEIENGPDKIVLVDVRPKFDFDRGHREGAQHMSFSSRMFMIQMEELVKKNKAKTIVVYCDSDNCLKSYRAVEKCQKNKLNNVVLFDLKADMAGANQEKNYSRL